MFTGLSAFPLTPFLDSKVDETRFLHLIDRIVAAGVDSIGALGSTGSYAYLSREERARVGRLAVERAGAVPVIIGIGAVSTRDVLRCAEDAQKAGARGLLLAPVSYQKLSDEEVFGLYEAVTRNISMSMTIRPRPVLSSATIFMGASRAFRMSARSRFPACPSTRMPPAIG